MDLILTQTPVQDEFLSTGTLLATGLIVTLGVIVFVEYFADRQPGSGRPSPSKVHKYYKELNCIIIIII